nr:MAG TPA: hypothetical protein [Caudoviricetes sp.]
MQHQQWCISQVDFCNLFTDSLLSLDYQAG